MSYFDPRHPWKSLQDPRNTYVLLEQTIDHGTDNVHSVWGRLSEASKDMDVSKFASVRKGPYGDIKEGRVYKLQGHLGPKSIDRSRDIAEVLSTDRRISEKDHGEGITSGCVYADPIRGNDHLGKITEPSGKDWSAYLSHAPSRSHPKRDDSVDEDLRPNLKIALTSRHVSMRVYKSYRLGDVLRLNRSSKRPRFSCNGNQRLIRHLPWDREIYAPVSKDPSQGSPASTGDTHGIADTTRGSVRNETQSPGLYERGHYDESSFFPSDFPSATSINGTPNSSQGPDTDTNL